MFEMFKCLKCVILYVQYTKRLGRIQIPIDESRERGRERENIGYVNGVRTGGFSLTEHDCEGDTS